jgi:hypothetical protein
MEDLVEQVANGNVTAVKVVLASVVAALAVYQVLLMAVGYGKLKLPFLQPKAASFAHRSIGDVILVISLIVALMCIGYFEYEDGVEHATDGEQGRALLHMMAGTAVVIFLFVKVVVVRWWHTAGRALPAIGLTIFSLLMITWLTSAGDYLFG